LQRALCADLHHVRPAVPGDVRPVPPGDGDESGKRPDHLGGGPRHGSYCCPKNRGCVDFSLRFPHLLRHSAASPDTGPGLLPLSESGVHALR
ncbi:Translation initiation factor 2, partial [Dysosmobacter welbionis]